MAMNENPLNLPLGANEQPHQLRLRRLTDQDAGRRVALCTPVLNHITTTNATALFNALERAHQIAALQIEEEDGTTTGWTPSYAPRLISSRELFTVPTIRTKTWLSCIKKLGWDT